MKITKDNYPVAYNILDIMSHGNGAQAGHDYYFLPDEVPIDRLEASLTWISEDERQTIAIGDQDEALDIKAKMKNGSMVDIVLGNFFMSIELGEHTGKFSPCAPTL